MKTGKITAKLRDMVPVCLMVDGKEAKRYANIELPDSIKDIDLKGFGFNVQPDGKIIFEIYYEAGKLPEVFPEPRARKTRRTKDPATAALVAAIAEKEKAEEPTTMELVYNVAGEQRKALAEAISTFTGMELVYKGAPTFAYEVGDYTINKSGTVSGPADAAMVQALAIQGFTSA